MQDSCKILTKIQILQDSGRKYISYKNLTEKNLFCQIFARNASNQEQTFLSKNALKMTNTGTGEFLVHFCFQRETNTCAITGESFLSYIKGALGAKDPEVTVTKF